jgi:hypothetical protein
VTIDNVVANAGIGDVWLSGRVIRQDDGGAAPGDGEPGKTIKIAEDNEAPAEADDAGAGVDVDDKAESRLQLFAEDIRLDHAMRGALPPEMQDIWDAVRPSGQFGGKLNIVVPAGGKPKVIAGSTATLSNVEFGRYLLPDASFGLRVDDDAVTIRNLKGSYYGGRVRADVRLGLVDARWEADIKVYGVDVKQLNDDLHFARGEVRVRGFLGGDILMQGRGTDTGALHGGVHATIHNGELANIPVIADAVMSLLSLRIPKSDTITDAEFFAQVNPPDKPNGVVQFEKVRLSGTSVPIGGKGTITMGGKIDMDFYTSKDQKSIFRIIPILGKPLDDYVISELRSNLVRAHVTGDLPKVSATPMPVPGITKPIKGLFEWAFGSSDDADDEVEKLGPQ